MDRYLSTQSDFDIDFRLVQPQFNALRAANSFASDGGQKATTVWWQQSKDNQSQQMQPQQMQQPQMQSQQMQPPQMQSREPVIAAGNCLFNSRQEGVLSDLYNRKQVEMKSYFFVEPSAKKVNRSPSNDRFEQQQRDLSASTVTKKAKKLWNRSGGSTSPLKHTNLQPPSHTDCESPLRPIALKEIYAESGDQATTPILGRSNAFKSHRNSRSVSPSDPTATIFRDPSASKLRDLREQSKMQKAQSEAFLNREQVMRFQDLCQLGGTEEISKGNGFSPKANGDGSRFINFQPSLDNVNLPQNTRYAQQPTYLNDKAPQPVIIQSKRRPKQQLQSQSHSQQQLQHQQYQQQQPHLQQQQIPSQLQLPHQQQQQAEESQNPLRSVSAISRKKTGTTNGEERYARPTVSQMNKQVEKKQKSKSPVGRFTKQPTSSKEEEDKQHLTSFPEPNFSSPSMAPLKHQPAKLLRVPVKQTAQDSRTILKEKIDVLKERSRNIKEVNDAGQSFVGEQKKQKMSVHERLYSQAKRDVYTKKMQNIENVCDNIKNSKQSQQQKSQQQQLLPYFQLKKAYPHPSIPARTQINLIVQSEQQQLQQQQRNVINLSVSPNSTSNKEFRLINDSLVSGQFEQSSQNHKEGGNTQMIMSEVQQEIMLEKQRQMLRYYSTNCQEEEPSIHLDEVNQDGVYKESSSYSSNIQQTSSLQRMETRLFENQFKQQQLQLMEEGKRDGIEMSSKLMDRRTRRVLEHIFNALDNDSDGLISGSEVDLTRVNTDVLIMIQDVLIDVESLQRNIDFETFTTLVCERGLEKNLISYIFGRGGEEEQESTLTHHQPALSQGINQTVYQVAEEDENLLTNESFIFEGDNNPHFNFGYSSTHSTIKREGDIRVREQADFSSALSPQFCTSSYVNPRRF